MGSIGDLFLKLGIDVAGFAKDVEIEAKKAGETSAKTLSGKLGEGLRTGAKAVALGATAMFAVATKGALDLEDATAKYRAETGATAEEATKAGHAIAEMSRSNLQGIAEIGSVLTSVTKNFGLTGDAANAATQQILTFATATGQDATEATAAFDDVLDSWHKTAADMPGIMDQIVASTQKYGGSVGDAEAALTSLAPAIQAMGGDMDDAIGVIDLFRASGLDAAAAAKGLQTALSNLKPGQTLDDLIAQISAIEDPTKRAQEAMKVFGTRAGAGMANALHPGITSLDQFTVSIADSAGATEKAAGIIESEFTNRIKLAIGDAVGALAEFGSQFGPLLTGLATIAPLMGPTLLKAGKAGVAVAGDVLGAIFGSEFASNIASTATGAAGTIVGNLSGELIKAVTLSWNQVKTWATTGASGAVIGAAGAAVGAVFSAAVFAANTLIDGLSGVLKGLGTAPAVLGAAGTSGAIAGAAFQAAFLVGIAALAFAVEQKLFAIGRDLPGQLFGGKFRTADQQMTDDITALATTLGISFDEALARVIAEGQRTGNGSITDAIAGVLNPAVPIAALQGDLTGRAYAAAEADAVAAGGGQVVDTLAAVDDLIARGATNSQEKLAGILVEGAHTAVEGWGFAYTTGAQKVGYEAGSALDSGVGQGMRDGAETITSAAETIRDLLKNGLTVKQEVARALGSKAIQSFEAGMASRKIGVKETTADLLVVTLAGLQGTPMDHKQSRRYGQLLALAHANGITDEQIAAEKAGCTIANHAHDGVSCVSPKDWRQLGWSSAKAYAEGISEASGLAGRAAAEVAAKVWRNLHTHSPAKEGPLSLDGGPGAWGERVGRMFSEGTSRGLGDMNFSIARPSFAGLGLNGSSGSSVNHTGTILHDLTPRAAQALRDVGYNEQEVARNFVLAARMPVRR